VLRCRSREAGFTLAELVVATTLISVVMICVYQAFNTSVRSWRMGESNRAAYQDVRIAMSVLTRDLQSMVSGAGHLFEGKRDELEFYVIGQPMDVRHGEGKRALWVRYRTKPGSRKQGGVLIREEAQVEGPLPLLAPSQAAEDVASRPVKLGRRSSFELVNGVKDFEVAYLWMPAPPSPAFVPGQPLPPPPAPVTPVEERSQRRGWGRPQAVRLALTVLDPQGGEKGVSTFRDTVVFRGPTRSLEERLGEEKP